MKKAPTPALALLPAGLFFCLGLQTVYASLEIMARDICLTLQLSPPMTMLIITTSSLVVGAGLALLTLRWLQRRSANGMTGSKMALGLALAYVLAVAFQFAYTDNFYGNVLITDEGYATMLEEYITYLSTVEPLILIARSFVSRSLIYLLVTWRCLR